MRAFFLLLTLICIAWEAASAADKQAESETRWRDWIETDFPFFSAVVDAREVADSPIDNNLTPRALVFPLGDHCFLAYDVDLLRVAAVWSTADSPFVNAGSAVISYPYQGNKAPGGTTSLPIPNGPLWYQNGIYAGVGVGQPRFQDPRRELPAEEKVVQGGLDPTLARFLGISLTSGGTIHYEVGRTIEVSERFALQQDGLWRHLQIGPHAEPVYVVLAKENKTISVRCQGDGVVESLQRHLVCRIRSSSKPQSVSILHVPHDQSLLRSATSRLSGGKTPAKRWPDEVRLPLPPANLERVLNLEELPLPLENPYGRAVRAASVDFFADGRAALVTFDGDVWLGNRFRPGATEVVWTRFTSGLHEPLSLQIRDEEIFVFDRNGIWRLVDRDENGEADFHELFCSRIDQTADTREFAAALEVEQDGSFLVCKPGQTGTFSAVLRISRDGKNVQLLARGFRQPMLGYDPQTGQIAASDQQGQWVPSTPVLFIEQDGYYGYPYDDADRQRDIVPPLTWIPHQICGSSMSIVWGRDATIGPLNDQPILVSYNPAKLILIHTDVDESTAQGGATPLELPLAHAPLLKAAINPADGLLYVTGFKIWGTAATSPTFLGRVRTNSTETWTLPIAVRVLRRGILLNFTEPVDRSTAKNAGLYSVRRWNYKRTAEYGSAHYRLDGSTGSESLPVASVELSNDGRSVFLAIPDMREVMQLEVTYKILAEDGTPIEHQTFLTAHVLRSLDLTDHGFPSDEVDLTSKQMPFATTSAAQPTVERGMQFYTQVGCVACHSIDGSTEGKNGPSWLGLYGSQRKLTNTDKLVVADESYLRESILNPTAKVAVGAVNREAGMPIYAGVLSDEQVASLLLFMKALANKDAKVLLNTPTQAQELDHPWTLEDFRGEWPQHPSDRSRDNGKLVFLGASCFACHRIGEGKGGQLGPDLATLDKNMRGIELLAHILEPSRRIDDKYKSRSLVTEQGKVFNGFLVFENDTEIHLATDPLAQRSPTVIRKSQIEEMHLVNVSAMPRGTLNRFDKQQVLDLIGYIESCVEANQDRTE